MTPELWLTNPLLVFLSWLPVPLGTAVLLAPAHAAIARRLGRPAAALAFFLLTRVGFAVLVYGLLGHRGIDFVHWHIPQGRAVLEGLLPYRDFPTLYAPGFPYLLALGVSLSPTWGMIALFVLADLGAFLSLARLSGGMAPRTDSPAWLYLAFPPVWYFEVRYQQDETVAALFLALALLALARDRPAWAGLSLAVGQLVTKPLFGAGALPLAIGMTTPRRAQLLYAAPVLVVYLAMTVAGIPWQRDLAREASAFGGGPVLWRLPNFWWGFELGRLAWLPEALAVLVGFAWLWRRRGDGVEFGAWMWGSHALLAAKLLPMYVVMVAPLLAVWVARGSGRQRIVWWALYGLAMGSTWYADSGPLGGLLGPWGVAFGVVGVLLPPALAVWLLVEVWRATARRPAPRGSRTG